MSATADVAASLATTAESLEAQRERVYSATGDRLRAAKTSAERLRIINEAAKVLARMEPRRARPTCGRCGRPAAGFAQIGLTRYCHDDPGPTCYELEQWEASGVTDGPLSDLIERVRGERP